MEFHVPGGEVHNFAHPFFSTADFCAAVKGRSPKLRIKTFTYSPRTPYSRRGFGDFVEDHFFRHLPDFPMNCHFCTRLSTGLSTELPVCPQFRSVKNEVRGLVPMPLSGYDQ